MLKRASYGKCREIAVMRYLPSYLKSLRRDLLMVLNDFRVCMFSVIVSTGLGEVMISEHACLLQLLDPFYSLALI